MITVLLINLTFINIHKFLIPKNKTSVFVCNRTKYIYLNDEPCMIRPTLIDLNPAELKYYPLKVRLDHKCVNLKAADMITNKVTLRQ